MVKRKACFAVVCGVLVLASVLITACGQSSPTTGATCGNTYGAGGTGAILVVTAQTTLTADDGSSIHIYNPNLAYGPVPSCVEDWIPQGCTDQGTVFGDSGLHEVQGTLPWVPYFQAANSEPQWNGMGVQTLRCGKTWRFLAWDDDSSHRYHELSAPGRTDCPHGAVRDTVAPVLVHDPYNQASLSADLEERGGGNDWVASQVDFFGQIIGTDVYPPHCPPDN